VRGNSPRRFFYGPGIENFDLALIKRLTFDTSRSLELRLETFNLLNHPQFYGPGAVDGNIVSPTFGQIITAAAPRFIQLAAKFTFGDGKTGVNTPVDSFFVRVLLGPLLVMRGGPFC
jgi:hypothetical protein